MSGFYTQNGWTGDKYKEVSEKNLSTVDIAKLIRKELKEKYLGIKVSVRSEYFANGSSIDVYIKDCGFNPINPEWDPGNYDLPMDQNQRYTDKAKQLLKELEKLGNKYRRSDCDGMIDYFDVNFWYNVSFDYDFEQECIRKIGIAC